MSTELQDRILVVDDSEIIRRMLGKILTEAGYMVDFCGNGNECLEYCKKEKPVLILLDVSMPDLSGLEVCKELRNQFTKQALPIIMVTSKTEKSDMQGGFAAGANDYVHKPIDRDILLIRLSNQLQLAKSYMSLTEQQELVKYTLQIQQATGDALDHAILVQDAKGDIVYYNSVCLEYCNNQLPKNIKDISNVIFNGRLSADIDLVLSKFSLDAGAVINTTISEQSSGWLTVRLVSRPIAVSRSVDLYRIWSWRDISEITALQQQSKEKVKLETVATFALGIAHNFNNLFAAMHGAGEKLRKQIVDIETERPQVKRCFSVISRSIEQGMALTKKMSSLTKRRGDDVVLVGTELRPVIETVVDVGVHVRSFAADIKYILDDSLNQLVIQVDYLNLLDICSHIISNAIDAMPEGGQLQISVGPSNRKGFVVLSFADTGCGMSAEVVDRVFEPFFSTKNIDQKNMVSMNGNGLGLWNVYNLVKLYDGDIKISSQVNSGTVVEVTLPCQQQKLQVKENTSFL